MLEGGRSQGKKAGNEIMYRRRAAKGIKRWQRKAEKRREWRRRKHRANLSKMVCGGGGGAYNRKKASAENNGVKRHMKNSAVVWRRTKITRIMMKKVGVWQA